MPKKAAVSTALTLLAAVQLACVHRTLRYETALKTDAEGTVTHDGLTIRHHGVTLVPSDLFVSRQDCLMSGKPVVPEEVVEASMLPKGTERPPETIVVWEKITITNHTEHVMYPFADSVTVERRPQIKLLDGKQVAHKALTKDEAIKLFTREQPCAEDLFKRKAVYDRLVYLDKSDGHFELLPNVDWTGWVAYAIHPPEGGNTGHWTFGFYEMPVGIDPSGAVEHTAAFQFGVDTQCYVDHFRFGVRQAQYALPEIQNEDSL